MSGEMKSLFPRIWGVAGLLLCAAAQAAAPAPPPEAGYVAPDGAIRIVVYRPLHRLIERLNEIYIRHHPGVRFELVDGNSLASLFSLVYDATAFAPIGGDFLTGAGAYGPVVQAPPFGIRIAHGSVEGNAVVSPYAVIVNPANPIRSLSVGQVARIFATGGRSTDLSHWGQLGMTADWAARPIEACGLPESDHYRSEDTTFGEYVFGHVFGGLSATKNYLRLTRYADVVGKVASDHGAIGIVPMSERSTSVRTVALSGDWGRPCEGTPGDIAEGRYPLDRFVTIYVRRRAGMPVGAFVAEYLRLALSEEGQRAIASEEGYIALNARERADELFKLN
jgi:phosphate transport system substrate-binding protein